MAATLAVAAVLGLGLAARGASAATYGASASVNIFEPIAITEIEQLDFGSILPPTSGTQDFQVSTAGVMSTAGTGLALGGHQRGEYSITGTVGASYTRTITVTSGGCTLPALTLNLSGVFVSGSFTLDATLLVGGILTVASTAAASPGPHSCAYTIQANY